MNNECIAAQPEEHFKHIKAKVRLRTNIGYPDHRLSLRVHVGISYIVYGLSNAIMAMYLWFLDLRIFLRLGDSWRSDVWHYSRIWHALIDLAQI